MSMPEIALQSGVTGSTVSAGTDIIQIADIAQQKNKYSLPINAAQGVYIDNRSNTFLLVAYDYGSNPIYEVLDPWQNTTIVGPDSIGTLTLVNLTDSPVPVGFLQIGGVPLNTQGYVIIAGLSDETSIIRTQTRKECPPFYQFAELNLLPNTTQALFGNLKTGGINIPIFTIVRIANFWNYDSVNPVYFIIFPGPDNSIHLPHGSKNLGGPLDNANYNGDGFFKLGPNGFFSMDCDWGDFTPGDQHFPIIAARNPSTTVSVNIGAMLRGY